MILVLAFAAAAALPRYPRPMPPSFRTIVQRAVGDKLLDGESARYRWPLMRGGVGYCGFVNAKNRYGAYTGFVPFFVNGAVGRNSKGQADYRVVMVAISTEDTESSDYGLAEKMCATIGYDTSSPPPAADR